MNDNKDGDPVHLGMSYRDYVAAQIASAIFSEIAASLVTDRDASRVSSAIDNITRLSFVVADRMVVARDQR